MQGFATGSFASGQNNGGAIYFGPTPIPTISNTTAGIEASWGGATTPQIHIGTLRSSASFATSFDAYWTGELTFTSKSVERMRVAANGFVGISNTSPKATLDVVGTISASDAIQVSGSALTCGAPINGALRYSSTSNTLQICVGTTWTSLSSSTTAGSDRIVSGTTSMVAISSTGTISLTQSGSNTGWFDPATGFVTIGVSSTGPISGTGGYFSGKLGIGTINPSQTLSVSNSASYQLQFQMGGSTNIGQLGNDSNGFTRLGGKAGVGFMVDSNERMRVAANGRVGVGTSAPVAALDVSGTVYSRAVDNGGGTSIDWDQGNTRYTSANCTGMTFTNMRDGSQYTLGVKGTSSGTCSFTHSGLTFRLPTNHGATSSGTMTVYSFIRMGTDVFVSWVPGY